jgi:hypothetical protein
MILLLVESTRTSGAGENCGWEDDDITLSMEPCFFGVPRDDCGRFWTSGKKGLDSVGGECDDFGRVCDGGVDGASRVGAGLLVGGAGVTGRSAGCTSFRSWVVSGRDAKAGILRLDSDLREFADGELDRFWPGIGGSGRFTGGGRGDIFEMSDFELRRLCRRPGAFGSFCVGMGNAVKFVRSSTLAPTVIS